MSTIGIKELAILDGRGLIPGPGETESDFQKRVNYCIALKDNFNGELRRLDPSLKEIVCVKEPAFNRTRHIYGFAPDWTPIVVGSHQFAPWHGGCAAIFQKENGPLGAFLQIGFSRLGALYDVDEVVAHECCHIGRMAFREPRFEEFLAYRVFKSPLRRFLGPILQSVWEFFLFLFILFVIFLLDIYFLFTQDSALYEAFFPLKLLPAALFLAAFVRLLSRHYRLRACFQRLFSFLGDERAANWLLFRLTDGEILSFGKMSEEEFSRFRKGKDARDLRWRLINSSLRDIANIH